MIDARPPAGPERAALAGFLDQQRNIVLAKAAGLTEAQLRATLSPSALTLAGLLNHLALVEDAWFRVDTLGLDPHPLWAGVDWESDPDYEFRTALDLSGGVLIQRYRDAIEASHTVFDGLDDLDAPLVRRNRDGSTLSIRWLMLHMIEETARHAGHADLLREAIDGSVG